MSDTTRIEIPTDYKTILVHVDGTAQAGTRIALASELALRHDAHLIGAAFSGLSRFVYQDGSMDLARTVLAPYMDGLYQKTERDLDVFRRVAGAADLPSWEALFVDDETGAGLALAARYADLVVLGQREPGTPAAAAGDLVAHVLLACARPLLVVPYTQAAAATGRRVLLGWNGSVQAMRALSAALPFMRRAGNVTVAVLGPQVMPDGDAAALASHLERHHIDTSFVNERAHLDVGEGLLSLAADLGADLLVMGGYGHARLHELVLGGATRTVLQSMTVPVLMAH